MSRTTQKRAIYVTQKRKILKKGRKSHEKKKTKNAHGQVSGGAKKIGCSEWFSKQQQNSDQQNRRLREITFKRDHHFGLGRRVTGKKNPWESGLQTRWRVENDRLGASKKVLEEKKKKKGHGDEWGGK